MPDFGAPVAQNVNVNPTNAIQTISGLLNLRQQQASIASTQAQAQQEQQTAQQRAQVKSVMSNVIGTPGFTLPDGTIDLNKLATYQPLVQAAGDSYPTVLTNLATAKQGQLGTIQTMANMDNDSRNRLMQVMGPLSGDPDVLAGNQVGGQKILTALDDYGSENPENLKIVNLWKNNFSNAPPQTWARKLSNMQLMGQAASSQSAAQNPNLVSTGGVLVNVARQSPGGPLGGVTNLQMKLPPGMQQEQDIYGNKIIVNQQTGATFKMDANGQMVPVSGPVAGWGGQPQGANAAPQGTQPPPQQPGSAPAAGNAPAPAGGPPQHTFAGAGTVPGFTLQAVADQKAYTAAVNPANAAYVNKNILNTMDTLSHGTITGPGTEYMANAETALGQVIPGLQGAADDATKRQLIGKYFEQLAQNLTYANFGNTDASRAELASALPNPGHMTPEAIQKAAQFIETQQKIAQARGTFATQYYKQHGSTGYQNADAQFMQNVDPRIFDYDAVPDNQKSAWLQKTFGNNKRDFQRFQQSYNAIDSRSGYNYNQQ